MVARASAPAAVASSRGSCWSAVSAILALRTPAETMPTTLPSVSLTGTVAWTSGPMVPLTLSMTVLPARAGAMVPTNFLPIRSGMGWV